MLPDSLLRLQTGLLQAVASCMETTEESGGKFKLSHYCRMYTGREGRTPKLGSLGGNDFASRPPDT